MRIHLLLIGILFLFSIRAARAITCYQCTDCPEPFVETYPYVTLANNTNFLARCTKTVMHMADGRRLVSKGTVFFCPTQTSTADAQIYCCSSDFCNNGNRIDSPMTLLSVFSLCLFKMYF